MGNLKKEKNWAWIWDKENGSLIRIVYVSCGTPQEKIKKAKELFILPEYHKLVRVTLTSQ